MAEAPKRSTTEVVAKLYEGKLRLERRNGSQTISARTFLQGKLIQKTTGERTLSAATKVATDWYLDLRDKLRKGEHLHGHGFGDMAEKFLTHAELMREVSEGQRRNYRQKWALLKPHFEGRKAADIDTRFLLELREKRSHALNRNGNQVKSATLKKDLEFVRLVLRYAKSIEKCISDIPEFPSFRGAAWEVRPAPRPFLDYDQWGRLRDLARDRIKETGLNARTRRQRQELYWFMLMCVGAALRVGEAYSLRWCDCELKRSESGVETLHMQVLGKHSRGGEREHAWGLFGAISGFKSMQRERPDARPDALLFTENHREGMKELLIAASLRVTPDGRTRDAKSLRPTGISLRLDRGDNLDYRDIARWARTSPAMVAAFYDQTHPIDSAVRVAANRERPKGRRSRRPSRAPDPAS